MSQQLKQENRIKKRLGRTYYVARAAESLVSAARGAALEAVQHRGFKVGAAAVAISTEGDVGIFSAANYMPKPDGHKVCAEQALLAKVDHHNFKRILGMVVSGPVQPDKHSGIELPTLHPCGDCRHLLNKSPLVSDSTLIIPVHPTIDMYEMYTRRELQDIHQSASATDAPDVFMHYLDPEFQIWSRGLEILGQMPSSPQLNIPRPQLLRAAVTGQLNSH